MSWSYYSFRWCTVGCCIYFYLASTGYMFVALCVLKYWKFLVLKIFFNVPRSASVTSRCSSETAKRHTNNATRQSRESSFLMPKLSAKLKRGHSQWRRQMQLGWVKIGDFSQITRYNSKMVGWNTEAWRGGFRRFGWEWRVGGAKR